jgi:transforming growth factor-beta-induced protein
VDTMRKQVGVGVMALAMLGAAGCTEDVVEPRLGTIPEVAQSAGSFATLLTAVEAAGLSETLATGGPFTVFAPTDAAFAALPAGALDALQGDIELLTRVLTYHVVAGDLNASAVLSRTELPTLNGGALAVRTEGGSAYVNDSRIVQTDVLASNGVIHVIDAVLLPEPVLDIPGTAAAAGVFNTLLAAVEAAGLLETLQSAGPFTVLAPTDEAFAALPEGTVEALLEDPETLAEILLYHVIIGDVRAAQVVTLTEATMANGGTVSIAVENGGVRVNDANVVATDIEATNGVIHVIDAVLIPGSN